MRHRRVHHRVHEHAAHTTTPQQRLPTQPRLMNIAVTFTWNGLTWGMTCTTLCRRRAAPRPRRSHPGTHALHSPGSAAQHLLLDRFERTLPAGTGMSVGRTKSSGWPPA